MYEEKRIRRALIRNTFLFFIVFALIFTVLGVFVFQMVNSNIYKAADAQLLGQGIAGSVFMADPLEVSALEATNEPSDSSVAPEGVNDSLLIDNEGRFTTVDPLLEINVGEGIVEGSDETQSYFGEASAAFTLSQQLIDENIEDNPQTIYLFRNDKGALLDTYGVNSSYPEYLQTLPFDDSLTSSGVYSITHEDHHFRSLIAKLQTSDGALYYIQAVINVDSEIEILARFTQTLVIGLLGALLACAAASYLLSRRTIRPIAVAWSKQTEFVQNASHELRTPLTVMQATQELLLEDPHAKIIDHFEDIALMQEESARLRMLAESLLLLSASDSQDMPLEVLQFSLDNLIEETASAFLLVAEEAHKEITLDLDFGKQIVGDEQKIRQVLIVLLDNALKYTKAGDAIRVASTEQNGMASFMVADTGIGISDEDLKHAFDRFFRADKARSRTNDGMGLGLSLARGILDAHGGSIEMDHNEPKGVTVTVFLPKE